MTIPQVQALHDQALAAYQEALSVLVTNPTEGGCAGVVQVLGHELREWDQRLHWSQ